MSGIGHMVMSVVEVERWWWGGGGWVFFFQAEDGIRDLVRSRGLGDVYKRQERDGGGSDHWLAQRGDRPLDVRRRFLEGADGRCACLLYTSDAADERSSVDLGGRRIIKKKITQS